MGCPADPTLALYWNWFAGTGLEEISSSSPRDVSAILYTPCISIFLSMLVQTNKQTNNHTKTKNQNKNKTILYYKHTSEFKPGKTKSLVCGSHIIVLKHLYGILLEAQISI